MATTRRRICVVTGSRAEYGLLYWLLRELRDDPDVHLQIVATGMHLSPEFGLTYREIENDGFRLDDRVEMLVSSDTPTGIAKSIGLGTIGFGDSFARLQPNIVVLLGDRFEILAAACAALVARIPIAHLHGGEATEGLIDEAIRHAVTKMAHLHFVAADAYRRRVVQMGEAPERVFNVGAPGLDHLANIDWLPRDELERQLAMPLRNPVFLVTYHPVTLERLSPAKPMTELLAALDHFPEATIVLTHPNSDTDGRVLIAMVDEYAKTHAPRVKSFVSLGQRLYLSLMRFSDVVIGNSSSGLTEAPAMKRATVNLGDRQRGRLKATSVIDCEENADAIVLAVRRALSQEFRQMVPSTRSLYGEGGASRAIKDALKQADLDTIMKKTFYQV